MRFALSAEQEQFGATLDALLTGADTPAAARAWAAGDPAPGRALWQRLAELGVTSLAIPERYDGLAAGPVETVVAFEQLGRHVMPGPLVESVAAIPALLTGIATGELAERWLPGIAAGKTIATLALPPQVRYAMDADLADPVLLADAGTLRLARVGRPLSSVDRTRRLFEVSGGEPLGAVDAAAAFDAGALASAAQLLGAGCAMLDTTVEYARQRHQFGRPIGSFQAVKHQLADVRVGLDLARPLVYGAAVSMAPRDVSAAKVAAGDAAYRAARTALQVHGAIGYTAEHPLHLWLTRTRALLTAWGTPRWHRTRILEDLC